VYYYVYKGCGLDRGSKQTNNRCCKEAIDKVFIFFEGISLLTNKTIAGNYGLTSWSIYNYNLTGLKKSERVRFVYALKGRGREKGLIEEFKGKFLAPGCFIVPVEKDNEILDILKEWKVKFERDKYMLMR